MADITSNLVVWYTFNNSFLNFASGTGVSDTTNNGTTIDNSIWKMGGGSLKLIAASQQSLRMNNITATDPNFFSNSTNGISFSVWVNYSSNSTGSFPRVFDIGQASSYTRNCLIYLDSKINLTAYVNSSPQNIGNYSGAGWIHIVWTLTYSTTNTSQWTIYVNKVPQSYNNRIFPNYNESSLIGQSNFGTSDGFYNGNIDDFRIYRRVLTQADVTALYDYSGSDPSPVVNIPCFREGTQILCFHNGKEQYVPVEKLRTGTLVKTTFYGYLPIALVGKKEMYNPSHRERTVDRLYVCSKENYPEILEDLYITGFHSILVKEITEEQKGKIIEVVGDIFITDDKYRLMACVDERAEPYTESGNYTIYHVALENDDYKWNTGIYANGLLVESCSKEYMELHSGLEII